MWFKANSEKKAFSREIRAFEKELDRKRKDLRKLTDMFAREPDPSRAKALLALSTILANDIANDRLVLNELIDKYNAM